MKKLRIFLIAKELKVFQLYVLRHSALTQLAEAGSDVFTVARIAWTLFDHHHATIRSSPGRRDRTGISAD